VKRIILGVVIVTVGIELSSCGNWNKTEKGTAIGATAGAVLGGVIGNKAGNTAAGAILGAVVGGAAGAYIGNQMDKQANEMRKDLEGARIERIGEGIKITFESGILFDVNAAVVRPVAQQNLIKLAGILNKYPETDILVEGHTDTTGTEEYNLELSKRRAEAVGNFLTGKGVSARRFQLLGYGESQPADSANTVSALQTNRRVEIAVFANEKLKAAALAKTKG
jgi:outer membrane protein OmpA-like peptidoglycan-associated protein